MQRIKPLMQRIKPLMQRIKPLMQRIKGSTILRDTNLLFTYCLLTYLQPDRVTPMPT